MSRLPVLSLFAAIALTLVAGPARAEPTARAKGATVTHYRALDKMLRRFSRQAGSPARPPIYANR